LKECGYRVTAIDPVEKLVWAAEQAGSADAYRIAAAADLPFENCSFDLVVAYNVLMDVDDVARRRVGASVAAASVLGGRSAPEAQPWRGCYAAIC